MARNRFDNLEPEKQEAILAAAAEEFAGRGYSGASLNRIIEEAEISKGLLYYYFDDKEDLFSTVVERAAREILEAAGGLDIEALEAATFWESLREFGRRSLEELARESWHTKVSLAFHRLRREPEARAATERALDAGRRLVRSLLERGRELEVVRTDLPVSLLVEVTMAADEAGDRWVIERWEELGECELRELTDARMDLLRDMLDAANEGWER